MSFVVDTAALGTAATALEAAAAALQAADVAGPFSGVPEALAGSATSEAAIWVSTRVAAAVQVLGENVRGMSVSATSTADAYGSADGAADNRFAGVSAP